MLTSLISFFIYRFGKVYNLPVLIRISQAIDEWLLLLGLLFIDLFLPANPLLPFMK
jgi:hypothetical protein